jgi:hypothetical protein
MRQTAWMARWVAEGVIRSPLRVGSAQAAARCCRRRGRVLGGLNGTTRPLTLSAFDSPVHAGSSPRRREMGLKTGPCRGGTRFARGWGEQPHERWEPAR